MFLTAWHVESLEYEAPRRFDSIGDLNARGDIIEEDHDARIVSEIITTGACLAFRLPISAYKTVEAPPLDGSREAYALGVPCHGMPKTQCLCPPAFRTTMVLRWRCDDPAFKCSLSSAANEVAISPPKGDAII